MGDDLLVLLPALGCVHAAAATAADRVRVLRVDVDPRAQDPMSDGNGKEPQRTMMDLPPEWEGTAGCLWHLTFMVAAWVLIVIGIALAIQAIAAVL